MQLATTAKLAGLRAIDGEPVRPHAPHFVGGAPGDPPNIPEAATVAPLTAALQAAHDELAE